MDKTLEKEKRGKTIAVGDILPQLLNDISRKTGGQLPLITAKWTEMVGEQAAKHTKPSLLRGKKLTVEVDDSVWMAELARFHRLRMKEAINRGLEDNIIDEILFVPKRRS